MSCLTGQNLQERYRTAAVEWAKFWNQPADAARCEAAHDNALLDFVKHKQACRDCLSDNWSNNTDAGRMDTVEQPHQMELRG